MGVRNCCSKRIICLLLAVCLVIGVMPGIAATATNSSFTDISGHWAGEAIDFMVEGGFMQGTSDTTFEPNLAFSRAMAVTILHRMAGEPEVPSAPTFSDVATGQWYSAAVAWAHSSGVAQGVGGGRFAPNVNITRQEMAAILYRFAETQGRDMALASSVNLDFPDTNLIHDWAEDAINWAVYSGIMRGTDLGTLNPRGNATRAEAATVLMRFTEQPQQPEPEPEPEPKPEPEPEPEPEPKPELEPEPEPEPTPCDCVNCADDFYARYILSCGSDGMFDHWEQSSGIITITAVEQLQRLTFPAAITNHYTPEFFKTHYIVIVSVIESSGSNYHRVERVEENGNIHITRYIPAMGAQNIGFWHIVIELCRGFTPERFNTVTQNRQFAELDFFAGDGTPRWQRTEVLLGTPLADAFAQITMPTKDGYRFLGWVDYQTGEPFPVDAVVTGYMFAAAKWEPLPEPEPEPLCPELEARIKRDFQIAFNVYDLDTVWIEPYLGTYNGSVALYFGPGILDVTWREEVAGLIFSYRSNERIWVWNDGAFYTLSGRGSFGSILPSAYELGLLTAEDIQHLHFRFGLLANDGWQRSS